MMRINIFFILAIFTVSILFFNISSGWGTESDEIRGLLDRAEAYIQIGVVDKGAGRSFEEAMRLVKTAGELQAKLDPSRAKTKTLALEIETIRKEIEIFSELYEERFYGVFPLARLISQKLSEDEGFAYTEQLYHPPDVAAVNFAMHGLLNQIDNHNHPHVVITSRPSDHHLENVVLEALLRNGRSTPISSRRLVRELSQDDLDAFNRGEIDLPFIDRMLTALNLVDMIMITVDKPAEPEDATARRVRGDYYIRGEVVQGSTVDASPIVLGESFEYYGYARDRRNQHGLIVGTDLLLLLLAIVWAVITPWLLHKPLKMFYRISIGIGLFIYGRIFIIVVVAVLRKAIPDSTSMAASAIWWPAVLGYCAILAGGLLAWIGQALLSIYLPSILGERAVGSIFGLVALGVCSYFVTPLLLLDGSHGFYNIIPLVLLSTSLAVLFGFAARTGPPVPHYFMVGPLLIAPLAGTVILRALPEHLWPLVGLSGLLCLAALVRHRIMVARGTEELEPSAEEAAEADQQRLIKLGKKLVKKV
jgi:hypothetical protein